MLVTVFGNVTVVRLLPENEALPMLATKFGIVTVVRLLFENAKFPMLVTEFGIVTVVRFLLLNALSPMLLTGRPPRVSGMTSSAGQVVVQPVTVAEMPGITE